MIRGYSVINDEQMAWDKLKNPQIGNKFFLWKMKIKRTGQW